MSRSDGARGAKRVTAADVARSLGLSRATVGFVLNDTPGQTIPDATRRRVIAEAERLGYRPHTAARALASGRSHLVLVLLPEWPLDHSMRSHLDEASLVLDQAGYSLVTRTPHPGGTAVPLWESLSPDVVMALAPISDADYEAIVKSGATAVIPGRGDDAIRGELHYEDGPRLQVAHLVERGKRRIAYAGTADPRLSALNAQRRQLAEQSCGASSAHLVAADDVDAENVTRLLSEWMASDVDGVVAYNDDIAALVLGAALRAGVAIPAELAVVGHDDAPIAGLIVPSLSSVRVDTVGLGRFLAELALSRITGDLMLVESPVATTAVIAREST